MVVSYGSTLIRKVIAKDVEEVVVHPTVLLSVVDHYNRVAKDTRKRVVGTLLGYYEGGKLEITNCFAVPFEEDMQDLDVYFFDQLYHEDMYGMMERINQKEKIVGWYSTGTTIKKNDIHINEILRRFNNQPAFVIINLEANQNIGLPTTAYFTREETDDDGNLNRQFIHAPSRIGATPEEEIGVETLLRDIKDASRGSLSKHVSEKVQALKVLAEKLHEMRDYLQKVISGEYRYNQAIIDNYQDIFNRLPNLKVEEMVRNFSVKSNDYMYVIYVSTLIRSILSLHDLVNNKIRTKEHEAEKEAERVKAAAEKEEAAKKKREEEEKKKAEKAEADAKAAGPADKK